MIDGRIEPLFLLQRIVWKVGAASKKAFQVKQIKFSIEKKPLTTNGLEQC